MGIITRGAAALKRGITAMFKPINAKVFKRWLELGAYHAFFRSFGNDPWQSDIVRSAIRPITAHTSKAHAVSSNQRIANLLNTNPNKFMNGVDFLSKVRNTLEVKNTAFIYIGRDDKGMAKDVYPVPFASFEALEYEGELFIKFYFDGPAARFLVLPWADLAVLRKDYLTSDIWGDSNVPLTSKLEINGASEQGVENAVKSTANLRGILKNTKSMLSPDDIKRMKDDFVRDYMALDNASGVASLDATQEFTPITMNPTVVDVKIMQMFRDDVFRYYGVNDKIMMSSYDEDTMEAFYQSRIEPFLKALSEELTRKIFTVREQALGAFIMYQSDQMRYMSLKTKFEFKTIVDRGLMTPNEFRRLFNMAPFEGGDQFIRRLDTATTGDEGASVDEQNE